MKRVIIETVVAAAAMLSACQTVEQPKTAVDVEKETVLFTATLGPETRTYIEYDDSSKVYKTRWAEGDDIFIMARQEDGTYSTENGYLVDGVGTSAATFSGSLISDHYIAYYGYCWYNRGTGMIKPNMQQYQGIQEVYNDATGEWEARDSFADYLFPMYAVSDDTSFEFKNLCSVLKVSLTGADYVDNIVFTPNDPMIAVAGAADLVIDETGDLDVVMANDSTAAYSVIYQVRRTLTDVPTNCYIILPPQTYKGGFTVTVNSRTGCLTRTVTEDVVFERSQIRSMSPIAYKDEKVNSWSVIGSMSGWSEDIPMTYVGEGLYELEGLYLTTEDEFKFRANSDWATNLGAYDVNIIPADSMVALWSDGMNMMVETEGTYNIVLDVVNQMASFELNTDGPVICYTYDEVAALPDETLVLAPGHVFGVYQQGFIFNIGGIYNNCILVYQGTDQSMYAPVLGNQVNVLAYKKTYNGLPELYDVQSIEVVDSSEIDYGYSRWYDLTTADAFANIYINAYDYVKYIGTLEQSGTYWNVKVDGVDSRVGSISYPVQDLTPYIGKKVLVEGWFTGYTGGGKYVTTVLKHISETKGDGSTEDVVPGDDIVTETKSLARLRIR